MYFPRYFFGNNKFIWFPLTKLAEALSRQIKKNHADWSNTVIILPVSPSNLEVVVEEKIK